MAKHPIPMKPGYYWAKWRIAADGTRDGDDLTPSDEWEIVHVNVNDALADSPEEPEALSVSVCGVETCQWRDCFVWGEFVAPIGDPSTTTSAQGGPALSRPQADDGWRPMDSAPKDGSDIHVWAGGPRPETVRYELYDEELAEEVGEPGFWRYSENWIADLAEFDVGDATYWRPLPSAPGGGE